MLIHVYSGLMSRCNVIAHAYYLLKKNDDNELTIIWPLENDCRIHYKEVFSSDSLKGVDIRVIEYDVFKACDLRLLFPDFVKIFYEIQNRNLYKSFRKIYDNELESKVLFDYAPPHEIGWSGDQFHGYQLYKWEEIKKHIRSKGTRDLAVHAFSNIIYGEELDAIDLKCITFNDELVLRAKKIVTDSRIIGVHVRRTDHIVAIENSTTDKFFGVMDKELLEDNSARFFLATDSPIEEQLFIDRFGDHIIVQEHKTWGRNDTVSVQSGIIDMLCLSLCTKIYGSQGSVFSEFASKYGNKELSIV